MNYLLLAFLSAVTCNAQQITKFVLVGEMVLLTSAVTLQLSLQYFKGVE